MKASTTHYQKRRERAMIQNNRAEMKIIGPVVMPNLRAAVLPRAKSRP